MPSDTTATTGAGEGDAMDWEAAQPAADPPHPFDVLQLDEHIRDASAGAWDVPDLRPLQRDAIRLVIRPDRPNQVLLVAVTSAGKTHVLRVVGHILGGICIIFIPLLTLSADVMAKFTAGDERWGSIEVQHLDELWLNDKRKYRDVLERLGDVERTTTSAIFVFLSPQFLVNHRDALSVFLEAARKRTLRLVALDEVHLHVQHGTSFRAEIRELRDVFFRPVFDRSAKADHPYVIAQTGTFPADYVADLTALTTVPFLPENVLRGSAKEFERREISIHLHICNPGDYVKRGLTEAVEFVTQDDEGSIVVFVNSRYRSMKYLQDIEKKLDEALCDTNVLMINGQLQAEDKFHRIRIFCQDGDDEDLEGMTFRVLISTPAANAGIDKASIRRQFRFEWPRDLSTFFQEMGRGSRDGEPSICSMYGDLQSYEYIRSQTLLDSDGDDDKTTPSPIVGINSALSPLRQVGEAAAAAAAGGDSTTAGRKLKKYQLGPAARKKHRDRSAREIQEVISFFCLDKGCMHVRAGKYLHAGVLDPTGVADRPPCNNKCPICTGAWHKIFAPCYKADVIQFLDNAQRVGKFPRAVKKGAKVSDLLWGNKYWTERIFDRAASGVKRTTVDALFLSLSALGFIDVERVGGVLRWNVTMRDADTNPNPQPCFLSDDASAWSGLNRHPPDRTRKRNPEFIATNN